MLKGHIQLELCKFPRGASGTQLDALARKDMWRYGFNYMHGTGHGVGSYLNVHEGPHQIRMEYRPAPLVEGMTVTDERKEQVDFSDPYYEAVQFVIVPADSDIATADDLKNKTIGSQLGTTGMFLSEDIEGVTAQTYNRAIDAVNDLVNGRVDAVIIDKNPAEVFNTKFEGKVKIIDGAEFGFETEEYAIALPKGSELVDQINQALEDLKADGTFDALVAQYIGE